MIQDAKVCWMLNASSSCWREKGCSKGAFGMKLEVRAFMQGSVVFPNALVAVQPLIVRTLLQ